ncbi:hypothetical protein FHT40_001707 [Mycolicibacterium sp. BK556]|uniref:hypothetical protein n=1 Tax=Mycobacteriaceae TaxID=1762 RepID=UPI001060BB4F|nr:MULTISPECIES: hypothetical protein [Mycobacteriaceae]MBB3602074.1 hypothetical protein [Mycolicibacterium sp. BK556]MBB3631826.1 hypothetical protein [Mycolicibacterium sp. BK607]MBB3749830.1 hypothetical protein [Mycolicibacterium sp. BK634]TDO18882.1 hypothetical protein EV580_2072 [Mycobacterium sp. BK086]
MTGAAVASAAAIVAATPALVPTHDLAIGAPSPLRTSTAQVALTAITDITIQGINDAYWFGWGGYITDTNTYYPGVSDIYLSGAPGVLYYLVDNAAESFVPGFDLDNYYFEIGAPAVPYVAAGELFGTSSPIFQAAQTVFYYGVPNVINSIVVSATQLVPTFDLGPVKLGGGILASLFFYGQTPDYDPDTNTGFSYSTNGLSAILAYISTSISDNLPSAAALSGAASAAAAAVEGVVKNVENALNPTASSSAAAKKTAAAEVKTESTDSSSSTESTSSTGGSSTTESSSTESSSSTEGSSTDTSTSTTGVASSAKPATKATKPAKAPQNPLNKIGKQISDALGITKKSKPSTKTSSDSSSSSSSSDSGSSSSAGSAK